MVSKNAGTIAAVALSVVSIATPSLAIPTIRFDQSGLPGTIGGTLSYSGDPGAPVIGTGILFDQITGEGTPFGGSVFCTDLLGIAEPCKLKFTSGPNTLEGPAIWTWGAGEPDSFVLTGRIPGIGIVAPDTVLLSGRLVTNVLAVGAGVSLVFSGEGVDIKHEALVDRFFGAPIPQFAFLNSEFLLGSATIEADGGFSGDITNADLNNIVPEPASSLVMILGLGGLALFRGFRRRS